MADFAQEVINLKTENTHTLGNISVEPHYLPRYTNSMTLESGTKYRVCATMRSKTLPGVQDVTFCEAFDNFQRALGAVQTIRSYAISEK